MGSRGNVLKYKNSEESSAIYNVFQEDSKEHSRKPTYVRELIDKMFLNVPKIELFAREGSELDWDYWGNEVNKFGTNQHSDSTEREQRRKHQIKLSEHLSTLKKNTL
jgi:N6-adenosine-specific RNA methylase IME4